MKRHWDSSAITPRHDCWALSPYHSYKYDHTYRTCVSSLIPYDYIPFKVPFSGSIASCVSIRSLGFGSIHMKPLVHLIGLYLRQPEMYLDWSFIVGLIYVKKKKKNYKHWISTCLLIQYYVASKFEFIVFVCMYVCLRHLRSLFFVIFIDWTIFWGSIFMVQ